MEEFDNDGEAGGALSTMAMGEGVAAAKLLEEAFERAGQSIENSLARAARSGALSMRQLAEAITQTLAELAIERAVDTAFSSILGAVSGRVSGGFPGGFSGARGDGGFVTPGGAYLVGERGPEVFTPALAGQVSPGRSAAPITVNMSFGAGADVASIRRSQAQISTLIARAVARGQRNL